MLRRARCGSAFLLAALQLGIASGNHWRYGHIAWATCDGGFFDPAFPEVCRRCSSPLCVGVTVHTAIGANSVDENGYWIIDDSSYTPTAVGASNWLTHVQADVNAHIDDNSKRQLRLKRYDETGLHNPYELRIGYMEGLNENARPVSVSNPFNGAVECPVRPCGPSPDYNFYIDRLDTLVNTTYAHYSFQLQFDNNGEYSVFIDGCCRPSIFKNKFGLPFHMRAGIQLYAEGQGQGVARPYPKQSVQTRMPNVVMLREGGVAYDTCKEAPCDLVGDETICYLRFQVHAYHPLAEYRDKLEVRLATAGEAGWWRCTGDWDLYGEWRKLCQESLSEISFSEPANTRVDFRSDGDGYYFIRFMVSRSGPLGSEVAGLHSLSLMVDCVGCADGATQSVPLEFTVHVKAAPRNSDPPARTTKTNPREVTAGVEDAVPLSCPQSALQIYCGRERFELGASGSKYSQDFIRVAFKDPDDGTGTVCTELELQKDLPQQIQALHEASTLPAGIELGPLVNSFGGQSYLNPNGAAYVDLTWRPACENPANLGLQLLCFTARDSYPNAGPDASAWNFLYSPPSLWDTSGFIDSSNPDCPVPDGLRSSCVYVNVQSPMPNVPPAFVAPTTMKGRECSADCCDCCGQENCDCATTQKCCTVLFTTIGRVFKHVVHVIDGPVSAAEAASSDILSERDDHDSYSVLVNFTFPNNIKPAPQVRPMLYGCGSLSYDECLMSGGDLSKKDDALTELVWDLTGFGFSCFKPGANASSRCEGTEDVTTCDQAAGGSRCIKDPVPLPFRVCYRAQEQLAPWVDEALWVRTYSESPTRASCDVCFKLAIADRPIFIDDDDISPVQGAVFDIPAGREFQIPLTAAAANDAGVVVISILSDPGAPLGAVLGPPEKVLCAQVAPVCELFHESGFQRSFTYLPTAKQAGQRFEICFRASMQELKAGADLESQVSEPRCITIRVQQAQVTWDGTLPCDMADGSHSCIPQVMLTSTVGCNVLYHLQANSELYDLTIEHQKLATCSTCVDGGLAVKSCSETGNKWPCCGNGHCDGAEMGANCAADCQEDDSSLQILESGSMARATFDWTPARGTEGRRLLACFAATDSVLGTSIVHPTRTAQTAPSYCLVIDVERCAYCVPADSSMMYVAKQYVLNVDWLRLYNTNPGTPDPDGVFPYDKLIIGPTYSVHPGDTLLSIAGAAKTTLKSILENNPDILDSSELRTGQAICLVLCSASPTAAI